MKYCKKCLYPDTKPQLVFNEDGVCSACINNNLKDKINWEDKKKELEDRNVICFIHMTISHSSTSYSRF